MMKYAGEKVPGAPGADGKVGCGLTGIVPIGDGIEGWAAGCWRYIGMYQAAGEFIGFIGMAGDGDGHPARAARFNAGFGNMDARLAKFIAAFLFSGFVVSRSRITLQFVRGYINHDDAAPRAGTL